MVSRVFRSSAAFALVLAMASMLMIGAGTASAQDDIITIPMGELNDSGVSGEATLIDNGDGTTTVSVELDGASGDHPAHIHPGTCDTLDPNPEFPLASVDEDGFSETDVDIELADLLDSEYAINVHESAENLANYVSCGNIVVETLSTDDEETDSADTEDADDSDSGDDTAAVGGGETPTQTPATGVGVTATSGSGMIAMLAMLAVLMLGGGVVLNRREATSRS